MCIAPNDCYRTTRDQNPPRMKSNRECFRSAELKNKLPACTRQTSLRLEPLRSSKNINVSNAHMLPLLMNDTPKEISMRVIKNIGSRFIHTEILVFTQYYFQVADQPVILRIIEKLETNEEE